ncbi:hypothetical protein Dimus_021781 [Dionaea muscipula]
MASEEHPVVYNDDDLDDDDDNEPLNDIVIDEDEDDVAEDSESDTDDADADTNSTSSLAVPPTLTPISAVMDSSTVTLAIPAAVHHHHHNGTPPSIAAVSATKIASGATTPEPKRQRVEDLVSVEKRPIDDSRKLFQRLWTDEDEIELLQGFLEYTSQRGMTSSGHHHDTTAFYDQIKSKLQLDFNKNQLVEKLRRLKKKYRNIVSRISSGKDFVFKSSHDQVTFEISRKIWSNSAVAAVAIMGRPVDFDDDDQNPNSSLFPNYFSSNNISNISAPDHHKALVSIDVNTSSEKNMMMSNPKAAARKRSRVKIEEKSPKIPAVGMPEGVNAGSSAGAGAGAGAGGGVSSMQGLIEETVRSCMSPLLKEFINNAVNGPLFGGGRGKGIGGLAVNAIPLNFEGLNSGINDELVDEKWRKQQILELEVYSKRLELVQDQIKASLDELRSKGGS